MEPSTRAGEHDANSLGERFEVKGRLGHGGSGDVYEAFDRVLERTVAVKVLRPGNPDPQAGDRLLREARACARLSHGSIVTVHEVVEVDGDVGIVMERLPGASLDRAEGGTWERTLSGRIGIVVQILFALGYAHRHGVVHRDIKPRNVQLLPDGSIKVLDFGVAHITGVDTLTVTGTITGTVHYASPEQLRGDRTDARTDIYSTGILAYELLTGRRPFDGETIGAVVTKVLHEPLPKMEAAWAKATPEIEEILRKATAKEREERHSSAEEMRDALRGVLESLSPEWRGTELGPLPGRPETTDKRTERTRTAARSAETTVAPSAAAGTREADSTGTATKPRRWQPAAAIAAGIATAAVAGLLWANEWRAPATPERAASAAAEEPNDHFLPTSGANEAATEETVTVDSGDEETATAARADRPATSEPATRSGSRAAAAPDADTEPRTLPGETAKGLYYQRRDEPQGEQAGSAENRSGIRYRVLRRQANGAAEEVDASTTFRSGDRIRFAFEPNVDGFLYVAQRGSTGRWSVLLPHPEINEGRNGVTRFEEVTIPPAGWFRIDDNPGTEQIFVYLSDEPIEGLPGGREQVTTAHSADEHTVSVLAGSIRTRDLVFEKEATPGNERAAYVVNHANAGGAVAWTVELEHR